VLRRKACAQGGQQAPSGTSCLFGLYPLSLMKKPATDVMRGSSAVTPNTNLDKGEEEHTGGRGEQLPTVLKPLRQMHAGTREPSPALPCAHGGTLTRKTPNPTHSTLDTQGRVQGSGYWWPHLVP